MNFLRYGFAIGLVVLLAAGCTRSPIERAVKGQLLASEENVVVSDHCRGCHVHRNFQADPHLERVRQNYPEDDPLREANECLQCHRLRLENLFRKELRSTTRPHGALVELSDIPKPSDKPAPKSSARKRPGKEKKRRWYFFYLF